MSLKHNFERFGRLFYDRHFRFVLLTYLGFYNSLSDEEYLKKRFKIFFGKELDLQNPKTFSEKLQWLKLYDRKPQYTKMVDKYEVKNFVGNLIGKEYVIPTLGVWDSFDDIDFSELPERFVLKTTHDSHSAVVCSNKEHFNKLMAKWYLNSHLKKKFFYMAREWPYKNVKPRIIAEEYIEDATSDQGLIDYKFFVFDGKVEFFYKTADRNKISGLCIDLYDLNFNRIPVRYGYKTSNYEFHKPQNFEAMVEIAEKLGKGIPFLRVDLYNINGKIYFGENTFYPYGGFMNFEPETYDLTFGNLIKLP